MIIPTFYVDTIQITGIIPAKTNIILTNKANDTMHDAVAALVSLGIMYCIILQ